MTEQFTREKILVMKHGRELDALVAEKVMGWEYIPTSSPKAGIIVGEYFFDPQNGEAYFNWSPSTDISVAWEVEEEIQKRKLLSRYVQALMDAVGVENHSPFDDKELFAQVHASPADRCKAALLAVMDDG